MNPSETLLLVDDEAVVRRLATTVLRKAGYVVLEAGDGREALALVEKHPEPIHLVVSDLSLPDMSGVELVVRLSAARQGLRALFISGHLEAEEAPDVPFLGKPFTSAALLEKVREALT
ncbi:MAG TPA: response regulator [Planctomycetota bacterium]